MKTQVPADGKWFNLEVDYDQDPMGVMVSAGCDKKDWEYIGPEIAGKVVYRVKLVRLKDTLCDEAMRNEVARSFFLMGNPRWDAVHSLKEAENEVDTWHFGVQSLGCRLLEGQAIEAFKTKYPVCDGKGPIIFGGSEWRRIDHPEWRVSSREFVPCLFDNSGNVWGQGFFGVNFTSGDWASEHGRVFNGRWHRRYRWAVVSKDS